MSSLAIPCHSVDEYLEIDRNAECPNEYVFGEIVAMAGGTPNNAAIAHYSARAISTRLDSKPCVLFEGHLRVLIRRGAQYAHPDATVVYGKLEYADEKRDTITNPKLVVEVLSDSTRNYDLGVKARTYFEIPSMTDLLLVEQDRVWVEYWSREPGGKWNRDVFTDMQDVVKIQSLDIEVPVAEFYAKVEFSLPGVE